jgi:transcription antitermination protein NusB
MSVSKPSRAEARRAARLAAVQALYQMEQTGAGVNAVVREFCDHRLGETSELGPFEHADAGWFARVVEGVVAEQGLIDSQVASRLADGWKLDRLDPIVRGALRCGTFELLREPGVPVAVAIDEYVRVVRAYHDGPEGGFVNGLLDRLARESGAGDLRS